MSVNPDEVVCNGAAVQGGVLTGDVEGILLLEDVYKRQVQRPLDIPADTRFVPRSELLDKRIDAQVENGLQCVFPVSYTHLDVYKRQAYRRVPGWG